MGDPAPESSDREWFSTTEAADHLRIPAALLRWLLHNPGFERGQAGQAKTLRRETVRAIDDYLKATDPSGRFRSRSGAAHRGVRRPRRRRKRSNYTTTTESQ